MSDKRKPPRRWTGKEDALLREAISKYDSGSIDWQEVASHLDGRTNKDCRKRWVHALRIEVTKGPWGEDEDERLEAGVRLHGCRWNKVSEVVGTRQADQCSRRWHECRNPTINRSRWSLWEDSILENAVRVYGRNWTEIVERFFYDRTPIAARNRYKQRFEKGSSTQYPHEDYQTHLAGEDGPSPESSTSGSSDRSRSSSFPLSWSEPQDDFSTYYQTDHLSATYSSPTNRNLMSPADSSDMSWLTSPTDVPSSSSSMTHQAIPDTGYPPTQGFSTSSSSSTLNHMAISDIEAAFREVYTTSSFGGYHNGSSPNLGFSMPANTPLLDYSTAGGYTVDGHVGFDDSTRDVDQMIRQLATYRTHMAGSSGR